MEKLRKLKEIIIEDMLLSIKYTPNRENDLVAFMKLYIKEEPENRPAVLDALRRCMDGEEYSCPYHHPYTFANVQECDAVLEYFLSAAQNCAGNRTAIELYRQDAEQKLNVLNCACSGMLLDDWRRKHIESFFDAVTAEFG